MVERLATTLLLFLRRCPYLVVMTCQPPFQSAKLDTMRVFAVDVVLVMRVISFTERIVYRQWSLAERYR